MPCSLALACTMANGCAVQAEGPEQEGLLTEGLQLLHQLRADVEQWKVLRLLSGPYDEGGAVISIQVGHRRALPAPPSPSRCLPLTRHRHELCSTA